MNTVLKCTATQRKQKEKLGHATKKLTFVVSRDEGTNQARGQIPMP